MRKTRGRERHLIIPFDRTELMGSLATTEKEFQQSLQLILGGDNPFEDWTRAHNFEDWTRAHNYSEEQIAIIYRIIDGWLIGRR